MNPEPHFPRATVTLTALLLASCATGTRTLTDIAVDTCTRPDSTIAVPAGFCVTLFADSVGAARHIAIAPNGDVYVNVQGGRRGSAMADVRPALVALRDTDRDGRADEVRRVGAAGGTGVAIHDGFVYQDVGTAIVRYRLVAGELEPQGPADTIVKGMPGGPGHRARNFVIDRDGTMYVNFGSATNACQREDRKARSTGVDPCVELNTRSGIWQFDARKTGQAPTSQARFATGLRNAVAMALHPDGRLFAAPHGRDQLADNWPELFTPAQNAELPAEEFVEVRKGDDFGWPYCYYDGQKHTRVTAPEYGGNGATSSRCARFKRPFAALPAHWGPNGMLFYTGAMLPQRYRSGAFIAFHGSWNRAPLPQGGFNVVFLPVENGAWSGNHQIFADGFARGVLDPQRAPHRPVGLAQAPDGAIFVTDDVGGRIWRITYSSNPR